MSHSTVLSIRETSGVGNARREAAALAQRLGFGAAQAGEVGIVVTEAANNLVKHAQGGKILLRVLDHEGTPGVEVLSLDKGRGIVDVEKCMADGYSTAGSPGTGLGAISRLADTFDIYSQPGGGTAVLAQLWAKGPPLPGPPLQAGAVCVSMSVEEPSGDDWALEQGPTHSRILAVDGLGHGLFAARAAEEAVKAFQSHKNQTLAETIWGMHAPLRSTRGASLAVAQLNLNHQTVTYAGVGNIRGLIVNDSGTRSLISHNGTVGHELHRVQEFSYPWSATSLLVMHSDGLLSKWDLKAYPGILNHHPSIIAGILYRDFERGRDDVTVVVARQPKSFPRKTRSRQ